MIGDKNMTISKYQQEREARKREITRAKVRIIYQWIGFVAVIALVPIIIYLITLK